MNFLINRIIFNKSEAALKFTILKNKFLIPVKPKKALSSYMLFSNEKRSTINGSITEVAAKLGAEWKNLPAEQKAPYQEKAKKMAEQQRKIIDEYEQKFVTPFKNITFTNLVLQKQSSNFKGIKIQQVGAKVKQILAKLTEEQKKKLQDEADKIKKEREQYTKKFIIPEAEFRTERSFVLNVLKQKGQSLQDKTEEARQKLKNKFQQYLDNFEKEREKFAKKHGITLAELNEIISLNKRKLKRENENVSDKTLEHLLVPDAPKKTRTRKTAAKTTTTKRTTTAKRATGTKKVAAKKTTTRKTASKKAPAKKTATKKA